MTVAAKPSSKGYNENGSTLVFPVPFRFIQGGLEVSRILSSGRVEQLAEGLNYSAAGGDTDEGGTLTLVTTIVGSKLRIRRKTPRAQLAKYTTSDNFPAASHEGALDRSMLIDQEQDDKIGDISSRSLMVPDGESAAPLPSAAERAGRYLVGQPGGGFGFASGTGNDPALRADLARPDGTINLGFQQSGDPDARVDFLLTKLREHVSVEDYYVGNPDDTDAAQKALERAAANGVACLALDRPHTIGGTLYNPGAALIGSGKKTLFQKVGVGMLFVNEYTAPARAGYYLTNTPLFSRTLTLSNIAHAAMFTVGHWAIIANQEFYDSPNLDPNKKGEFVRIIDIIGATIVLDGPVMDSYLIASQPELIPVTLATGVAYENFTCAMDLSVAPVGGADPDTELRQIITTRWALDPHFCKIWMKNSIGAGIALEGTMGASIDGLRLRDFGSAKYADGTNPDGYGGYGYGVSLRGLNAGVTITDIGSHSVRHTVTDGADYNLKIGRPTATSVSNGTSWNAKLSGWDTHQLGYGVRFTNLWAYGSLGPGFTIRSDRVRLSGCGSVSNLGPAVALYKGPSENAEGCVVDGHYAEGNNWGQTVNADETVTDWRYKGTFLDMGTNNLIRNSDIASSYGFAYETGPDAVNPRFEGARIRSINLAGLANRAFWLRSTGATTPVLEGIDIDVTGAGIIDLVVNASTSFSNIPRISEMSITGTITGVPYSSALANNQFVHWMGNGFNGYREAIASAAGSGFISIDLDGRIGDRFTITRTGTESLQTVVGREVEGATFRLICGPGSYAIAHGTGTNNLFLKGSVAANLTENQSIDFERRGVVWFEVGRSF